MKHAFTLLILILLSCTARSQFHASPNLLRTKAPKSFKADFRTTKGIFTLEVERKLGPRAADRIYQLLISRFYYDNIIFRVQKNYVVQFGISNNPGMNRYWDSIPISDEPVRARNVKGAVAFARDGKKSRTTQIFVDMKDNFKLDTVMYNGLRGFPPVGRIVAGFDVLDSLNGTYGFEPANFQDSLSAYGNAWMEKKFPGLDYIMETKITEVKGAHRMPGSNCHCN
jgi:cyclophilin family peptidyl-prolyl cis-trans isomerase